MCTINKGPHGPGEVLQGESGTSGDRSSQCAVFKGCRQTLQLDDVLFLLLVVVVLVCRLEMQAELMVGGR